MANFFPQHTVEWRLEEPRAFRRLSLSLIEMALLTGVVLRLLRALTFTHGRASWLFYGAAFVVGLLILLGMTTAYLANWTLRSWLWRAPLFALVEVAGEMATSLLLIAMGREPEGTVRAEFHDWPSMALLTGVVLRLLRALTFTHGRASWLFYGAAFVVGLLILLGMTTAYLANWTLRSWLWRAPLFALGEVAGEMATSLLLIAMGREPEGAVRAEFHDWPSMALRAFLQSEVSICVWAALLAGVIVFVRRSGIAEGVEEEPVVDPET